MMNYQGIKNLREIHGGCGLTATLTTDGKNTVVVTCPKHGNSAIASIPHRQFCLDPLRCAGHFSCPREYACCD